MLLLLSAIAHADVTVDDPTDCLDAARLENELALQLGDDVLSELEVRVALDPVDPPDADGSFATSTRVRRDGERLWSKRSAFVPADCPVLPEALAASIQQGLAGVPGFGVQTTPEPVRSGATVHLAANSGLPVDPRIGLHGGVKLRTGPIAHLWLQARLQTGPRLKVGSGAATLFQPGAALGIVLHGRDDSRLEVLERRLRPDAWALVWGGPLIAAGDQFDDDQVVVLPRLSAEVGAGLQLQGPMHAGLYGEIPILRSRLTVQDPNLENEASTSRTEPPIRIGIVVGLDFSDVR